MPLVYWGEIDAASDATMAAVTNRPGSQFRSALADLLEILIAQNATVTNAAAAAAAAAVSAEIAARGLAERAIVASSGGRWADLRAVTAANAIHLEVRNTAANRPAALTFSGWFLPAGAGATMILVSVSNPSHIWISSRPDATNWSPWVQVVDAPILNDRVAGLISELNLIDEANLTSRNFMRTFPETPLSYSSRRELPIAWIAKTLSDPVGDTHPDVYPGTWTGSGSVRGSVPVLSPSGQLQRSQLPTGVAMLTDIPAPVPPAPSSSPPRRSVRPEFPFFGARLAQMIDAGGPAPVIALGSSTSYVRPGYWELLAASLHELYPVPAPSAVQWSQTAAFVPRTDAGLHVYNAAVNGSNADTYLTPATVTALAALAPVAVIHMIGSNDFTQQRDPAVYKSDILARMGDFDGALARPTQHVLVHAYARRAYNPPTYPHAAYLAVLNEIAAARADTAVIDLSSAYRPVGVPGADPMSLIGSDNVHQTTTGYRYMAGLLAAEIIA